MEYVSGKNFIYVMEKLNNSIHELEGRVSACESGIAQLNNQAYNI